MDLTWQDWVVIAVIAALIITYIHFWREHD